MNRWLDLRRASGPIAMSVMRIRPVSILLTAIAVIWGRPALVIRMLPANGLFGRRGRCPHTEGKRRPVAPRQLLRVVRDRRRVRSRSEIATPTVWRKEDGAGAVGAFAVDLR